MMLKDMPGVKQMQSLTPLRGIAALVVLVHHAISVAWPEASTTGLGFVRGYLGVDLFFLLSGFVLAHVYGGRFAATPSGAELRSFFWARLARIYPVHLAVLALLLPLYGSHQNFSGSALLASLALAQGPWIGHISWNYMAWSLSAEWHAYLLFPFVVAAILRGTSGTAWRIGSVCAGAALFLHSGPDNIVGGPLMLLRALPEFMIGIALYRVYASGWATSLLRRDIAAIASLVVIGGLTELSGSDAAIIGILPWLLLAVAHNDGGIAQLLASRSVVFLGRISFSLYMVQMVPIVSIAYGAHWLGAVGLGSPIAKAAIFVVASFALGTILSRLVEYPARDWLRSLGRRRQEDAALLPVR